MYLNPFTCCSFYLITSHRLLYKSFVTLKDIYFLLFNLQEKLTRKRKHASRRSCTTFSNITRILLRNFHHFVRMTLYCWCYNFWSYTVKNWITSLKNFSTNNSPQMFMNIFWPALIDSRTILKYK